MLYLEVKVGVGLGVGEGGAIIRIGQWDLFDTRPHSIMVPLWRNDGHLQSLIT